MVYLLRDAQRAAAECLQIVERIARLRLHIALERKRNALALGFGATCRSQIFLIGDQIARLGERQRIIALEGGRVDWVKMRMRRPAGGCPEALDEICCGHHCALSPFPETGVKMLPNAEFSAQRMNSVFVALEAKPEMLVLLTE